MRISEFLGHLDRGIGRFASKGRGPDAEHAVAMMRHARAIIAAAAVGDDCDDACEAAQGTADRIGQEALGGAVVRSAYVIGLVAGMLLEEG